MGSSGEEPSKAIDATAGGLVWVRRRNGSWWPGKILGLDELPEGCVPTPRSGTPVKLLGREDASVDWYNLEKSKRVKAFHCGEYDDCIKKVKESASHLSKKGAKYARREDAILHALKLERARLGEDHPELLSTPVTRDGKYDHADESPSASLHSEESEDLNSSGVDSDSVSKSGQSEDDGYEGVKRMRGLEDLGMGRALSMKKKGFHVSVAHVQDTYKRKYRHRPMTKVMASSTMVPASVPVAPDITISALESNESNKNDSGVINNNSDSNGVSNENGTLLDARHHANDASPKSLLKDNEHLTGLGVPENEYFQKLFDVPLVAEEQHSAGLSSVVSDASQPARVGGVHSSESSHVEAVPLANEEQSGSGLTISGTANIHDISQSFEKGTSEWRFKGKRNSRPRKVDNEAETDVACVDRESLLTAFNRNALSKNQGQSSLVSDNGGYLAKSKPTGWSWNSPQIEAQIQGPTPDQIIPQRLLPYRQSRFTVNPKYDDSDISRKHHVGVSGLFEVNVEVKTSYRPQHVPYISLMSKFTGRPIIGHPLTIEVLEDGFFSSDIVSNSECSELNHNLSKQKTRGGPLTKLGSSRFRTSVSKSPRSRSSAVLSKKTRRLSSLTAASHRLSREKTKPAVEKLKGPSIACVPLKIVFSRINAALSGSVRSVPRPNGNQHRLK